MKKCFVYLFFVSFAANISLGGKEKGQETPTHPPVGFVTEDLKLFLKNLYGLNEKLSEAIKSMDSKEDQEELGQQLAPLLQKLWDKMGFVINAKPNLHFPGLENKPVLDFNLLEEEFKSLLGCPRESYLDTSGFQGLVAKLASTLSDKLLHRGDHLLAFLEPEEKIADKALIKFLYKKNPSGYVCGLFNKLSLVESKIKESKKDLEDPDDLEDLEEVKKEFEKAKKEPKEPKKEFCTKASRIRSSVPDNLSYDPFKKPYALRIHPYNPNTVLLAGNWDVSEPNKWRSISMQMDKPKSEDDPQSMSFVSKGLSCDFSKMDEVSENLGMLDSEIRKQYEITQDLRCYGLTHDVAIFYEGNFHGSYDLCDSYDLYDSYDDEGSYPSPQKALWMQLNPEMAVLRERLASMVRSLDACLPGPFTKLKTKFENLKKNALKGVHEDLIHAIQKESLMVKASFPYALPNIKKEIFDHVQNLNPLIEKLESKIKALRKRKEEFTKNR